METYNGNSENNNTTLEELFQEAITEYLLKDEITMNISVQTEHGIWSNHIRELEELYYSDGHLSIADGHFLGEYDCEYIAYDDSCSTCSSYHLHNDNLDIYIDFIDMDFSGSNWSSNDYNEDDADD